MRMQRTKQLLRGLSLSLRLSPFKQNNENPSDGISRIIIALKLQANPCDPPELTNGNSLDNVVAGTIRQINRILLCVLYSINTRYVSAYTYININIGNARDKGGQPARSGCHIVCTWTTSTNKTTSYNTVIQLGVAFVDLRRECELRLFCGSPACEMRECVCASHLFSALSFLNYRHIKN